jgi:hypothetical protein
VYVCVYMVDEEWTPFGMIVPSLLFDDFETWAMFLSLTLSLSLYIYTYIYILMHAHEHVFSSLFLHSP